MSLGWIFWLKVLYLDWPSKHQNLVALGYDCDEKLIFPRALHKVFTKTLCASMINALFAKIFKFEILTFSETMAWFTTTPFTAFNGFPFSFLFFPILTALRTGSLCCPCLFQVCPFEICLIYFSQAQPQQQMWWHGSISSQFQGTYHLP